MEKQDTFLLGAFSASVKDKWELMQNDQQVFPSREH